MPYNNMPIFPNAEVSGTASLPLARVKKIIAADPDISNCSNNAAFVLTIAAEMFVQHLVDQSYNIVKSERKPRRNIQYRDVANAVSRVENLEFLTDVVPKTNTYRNVKARQAGGGLNPLQAPAGDTVPEPQQSILQPGAPSGQLPPPPLLNGQRTLDNHFFGAGPSNHQHPPSAPPPQRDSMAIVISDDEVKEAQHHRQQQQPQATNGASARDDSEMMDVDEDERLQRDAAAGVHMEHD